MPSLKKIVRNIGRGIGKLVPSTGRSAAKRAERQANEYIAESRMRRAETDERAKKERKRAQKLAIRGLRSRRAASHFSAIGSPSYGSPTIG